MYRYDFCCLVLLDVTVLRAGLGEEGKAEGLIRQFVEQLDGLHEGGLEVEATLDYCKLVEVKSGQKKANE